MSIDLQLSCHIRMIRLHSLLFKKLTALMKICEREVLMKWEGGSR